MNIPQLSIQERDRRYQIVRAEMAKRGIDVSCYRRTPGGGSSYKATRAI